MPELGKYAFAVLASYGAGLALLGAVVALVVWRFRRAKAALIAAEARLAARAAQGHHGQANGGRA
ncbi:heme exporter protein CcmD [Gemmobacter serpentinus]|uniref:heme exporter protein CcmD n=1 Tax=Gemmobacter serpentinus TaxID=2652247 RepID=UPI00384EBBB4